MIKVAVFEKVSENIYGSGTQNVKIPTRATRQSAGYDFYAPFTFSLGAGESIKIPTGVRVKIDDGWFLAIYPRSGLGFKYRLRLDNTVGIIDADYYYSDNEGHIIIKMTNCGDKPLSVETGQAFAQGVFTQFGITYDDNAAAVRNGGFGSTDK